MRSSNMPSRSESPIARMQRAYYPREPHPLAHLQALRAGAFGALRAGMGGFGSTVVNQGVTGIKTGASAAALSTGIGTGVASAIGAGAAAGSIVPIVGTAIGAIIGLFASGVLNHKVDPEVANFNQAIALANQQGPQAAANIANKYLVLAGLFDLESSQVKGNFSPYTKYGRMGENAFVHDLCAKIQSAANTGAITANDTPISIFNNVVNPWIQGMGTWSAAMPNHDMLMWVLIGMIAEYCGGATNRWASVGGQNTFTNVQPFALPTSATQAATSTAPSPVSTAPAQPVPVPVAAAPQVPQPSQPIAPPTIAAPQVPQPVQGSAVPVPTGFNLVGSANNLPAYQGPDGAFYSWSGTTMSPLTGTLMSAGGTVFSVQSGYPLPPAGAVQAPLPSLATNTQAGVSPYAVAPQEGYGSGYIPYSAPSSPIPTTGVVAAGAGVGTGLPSWLTWGAVGGVALLMLATARPVSQPRYRSAPRRRR